MPDVNTCAGKVYRTRDPEASPFFTLVRDYFDEFERVYPQRFQKQYGFWRPVIRDSIDKFLKCGDLKDKPICSAYEMDETDSDFAKKRRMSWAALIKSVYEVDSLECPNCGGRMKIISFIEKCQPIVIEKILRHCGMLKETVQRPPPTKELTMIKESSLDNEFFDRVCI